MVACPYGCCVASARRALRLRSREIASAADKDHLDPKDGRDWSIQYRFRRGIDRGGPAVAYRPGGCGIVCRTMRTAAYRAAMSPALIAG